ncbi:hypothetical protein LINGRAHAP2_LOCUS8575 [Linum grandiflorum]
MSSPEFGRRLSSPEFDHRRLRSPEFGRRRLRSPEFAAAGVSPEPRQRMLETESMRMPPFVIDSDSMFICGSASGAVAVFSPGSNLNSQKFTTKDFKPLACAIGSGNPKVTGCTMIPATSGKVHFGVEIFGKLIEGETLDKLANELWRSRVLVNCDGYQVVYSDEPADGVFQVSRCRLTMANNMFGWRRYGVKSPEGRVGTVWNRFDMYSGETVVDYVAAEEKAKVMASELKEMETKYMAAEEKAKEMASELEKRKTELREKEENLKHYKLILKGKTELIKEMETMMNEVKGVVEKQSELLRSRMVITDQ